MSCTKLFYAFFEPIAASVEGVKTVHQSGGDKMDRLLAASSSEDIYPAVFALRPKYALEDNGAENALAWFDSTYYVICRGEMGQQELEDAAFDEAERIGLAISLAIRENHGITCLVDPSTKVFMEPITMITLEASYGYEVRMRVGLMANSIIYTNS
ncbi:hypothetical protein GO755_35055 [Spirosoma sp. HMF4905]|uniref:Uncharacterized protein n=1 Tax=Spirosoma arboris TaxID=2682092 RepID=A0A7K1SNB8_9BACT|nr:hypothetical protein [Spirosoma arboris]MVM35294.1 hypothetical protein [Spirosoma arboris]